MLQHIVDHKKLTTFRCSGMLGGMITKEQLVAATQRLIARFGTPEETKRSHEDGVPPRDSDLIDRVITAGASTNQAADPSDIKAALTLLPANQWAADNREFNLLTVARNHGLSWREIANRIGMASPQAAQQRYLRLAEQPPRIYAFRVADEGEAPWHGDPDCLPDGNYETAVFDFDPAPYVNSQFAGKTLEVRHGRVPDDDMPDYLRGFPMVDGRRIGTTDAVQRELFNC